MPRAGIIWDWRTRSKATGTRPCPALPSPSVSSPISLQPTGTDPSSTCCTVASARAGRTTSGGSACPPGDGSTPIARAGRAGTGPPDPNLTVLVHDEQGLGDTLQFVRYLPEVRRRCGRVILETRRELIPLLKDSAGVDAIVARPEDERTPGVTADLHVPLMSLPLIFGTTGDTVPAEIPYIRPDPLKSSAWGARIDGPGLKVGLVWAGRPEHQNDHNRSCRLDTFLPLSRVPGVRLYSLQKGPAESQIADSALRDAIVHLGPSSSTSRTPPRRWRTWTCSCRSTLRWHTWQGPWPGRSGCCCRPSPTGAGCWTGRTAPGTRPYGCSAARQIRGGMRSWPE